MRRAVAKLRFHRNLEAFPPLLRVVPKRWPEVPVRRMTRRVFLWNTHTNASRNTSVAIERQEVPELASSTGKL